MVVRTSIRISITVAFVSLGYAHAEEPAAADPIDRHRLEGFANAYFRDQMPRMHVPGAVLAIVANGSIVFAKGYGYADLQTKTAVTPERTLFRVASVSKVFTATAVMQLVEQDRIRIDDDVNKHLRLFKVPPAFGKPVTVGNLLTHTGGFDERLIGMAADPLRALPLGVYLAQHLPPRTMPPGAFISYSNHGYALAGYLVEVVSGTPFADYMEAHVLRPLGMTRSSFHQPLPPELAADLATGYEYRDGTFEARPRDVVQDAPAGALALTASDAARFMIAHLQKGRADGAHILRESTAAQMHQRQFSNHPRLPGIGYGFWERSEKSRRALAHDGGWNGFYSLMYLLPEQTTGIFVAANALDLASSAMFGDEFVATFVDQFYPAPPVPVETVPAPQAGQGSSAVAGAYRGLRIPPQQTFEKVLNIVLQVPVWSNHDGTLTLQMPLAARTTWHNVEPFVFREAGGKAYCAFREDSEGHVKYLLTASNVWEKLPWYDLLEVQLPLLAVMIAVFAVTPVAWMTSAFRDRGRRTIKASDWRRVGRLLLGSVCVLNLSFLVGLCFVFADYPMSVARGLPYWVVALFVLPLLSTIATLASVGFAVQAWRHGQDSLRHRVQYSVVVGVALGFVVFLGHWNLLGFHF